jgi:hypothetical protein
MVRSSSDEPRPMAKLPGLMSRWMNLSLWSCSMASRVCLATQRRDATTTETNIVSNDVSISLVIVGSIFVSSPLQNLD